MRASALRRQPIPQTAQDVHFPAPVGGINTTVPIAAMPGQFCLQSYNLVAAEYGLRVRLGSQEWCTGLTGVGGENSVKTLIPYAGSAKSGSKDRLFATTLTGIWDVTSSSATPTQVYTFGTQTGDAGHGVWTGFVTPAGAHYIIYTDEVNGALIYTEATDAWTAFSCTVATAANLVAVCSHKNRLWFAERDTGRTFYMPVGAISGAAAQFDLGNKYRAGGRTVGIYSWTLDGGAGVDDYLVFVSAGGDVVVYQGTNPASLDTWQLRGVWFAGQVPAGRRVATAHGGDLLLLTRGGIFPLSRLVVGTGTAGGGQYETAAIAPLFNRLSSTKFSLKGWSLVIHPEDNSLIVTVPTTDLAATEQLAMSLSTKGWGQYRDLPIYCAEPWQGTLYYGTVDGKVGKNTGYVDGVTLASPNDYSEISWSLLTGFTNGGNARQKQVTLIRPTILSDGGTPEYKAEARYRYDFTEVGALDAPTVGGNTWDNCDWDEGVWSGEYATSQTASGATGMGTEFAVALKGNSVVRTVIAGVDVVYQQGGVL